MPVVKPLTDRGYRALWSMRLARKAGCCMPPPDRPEVLLHKARQDELVVERLLADRAGHEETPDSLSGSGAAWCRYKGGRGKTVAEAVKKICVTLSSSSGAK